MNLFFFLLLSFCFSWHFFISFCFRVRLIFMCSLLNDSSSRLRHRNSSQQLNKLSVSTTCLELPPKMDDSGKGTRRSPTRLEPPPLFLTSNGAVVTSQNIGTASGGSSYHHSKDSNQHATSSTITRTLSASHLTTHTTLRIDTQSANSTQIPIANPSPRTPPMSGRAISNNSTIIGTTPSTTVSTIYTGATKGDNTTAVNPLSHSGSSSGSSNPSPTHGTSSSSNNNTVPNSPTSPSHFSPPFPFNPSANNSPFRVKRPISESGARTSNRRSNSDSQGLRPRGRLTGTHSDPSCMICLLLFVFIFTSFSLIFLFAARFPLLFSFFLVISFASPEIP
jgi:hypothetical protein